jgi:hypothetical protein
MRTASSSSPSSSSAAASGAAPDSREAGTTLSAEVGNDSVYAKNEQAKTESGGQKYYSPGDVQLRP